MKKRFAEAQIIGFLLEAEAGLPVKEPCRRHGFSEACYLAQQVRRNGVSDAKRLKALEAEKQAVTAPVRRTLARHWVDKGLSERRALAAVRRSARAPRSWPPRHAIQQAANTSMRVFATQGIPSNPRP